MTQHGKILITTQKEDLTAIPQITISKSVYEQLLEDQEWLRCLKQAGVDNWEGIGMAYEIKDEIEKEAKQSS